MNRLITLTLGLTVALAGFGATQAVMANPDDCPFTSDCPLGSSAQADSPATEASGCENGCAMLSMENDPGKCFEDLNLSKTQREKTGSLITALKRDLANADEQERATRIRFAAALVGGAEEAAVTRLRNDIVAQRQASLGALEQFYIALRSILDDEQRQHLQGCVSCGEDSDSGCGKPAATPAKKSCCEEKAAQSAPQQPPACCEEGTN